MRRMIACEHALLPLLLASFFSFASLAQVSSSDSDPTSRPPHDQQPDNSGVKTVQDIEARCNFSLAETDSKKIRKANACVADAIRVRQERVRLQYRLEATKQAESQLVVDLAQQPNTPAAPKYVARSAVSGVGENVVIGLDDPTE